MKISVATAARANLNNWKAGQGAKIKANRPDAVYKACLHVAGQLSALRDPLVLDQNEVQIAIKRAVSQERRRKYGDLPKSDDVWWEQIESIGQSWTVKFKRGDWSSDTPKREAA